MFARCAGVDGGAKMEDPVADRKGSASWGDSVRHEPKQLKRHTGYFSRLSWVKKMVQSVGIST